MGWMQHGTHAPPADDDGNANSLEAASSVWWSHTVCRPVVLCAAILLVAAPWLLLAWRALWELSNHFCRRPRRVPIEQPRGPRQLRQLAALSRSDGDKGSGSVSDNDEYEGTGVESKKTQ